MNIYLLHKKSEVFNTFHDTQSVLNFFNRTGRVRSYRIIIHIGDKARVIENPAETMMELTKEMNQIVAAIK